MIAVTITSYNPHVAQTDNTPEVGASGRNLVIAAKEGDRTIALSRDLLWYYGKGKIKWHDKVKLVSDNPQCNGLFSVEDTMNKRFSNRADMFFLSRKDNTSCKALLHHSSR